MDVPLPDPASLGLDANGCDADGFYRINTVTVTKPGSPPDVDSDIAPSVMLDVLQYVTDTYGAANVAHIGTFGTRGAKQALKDACSIHEVGFTLANKLTELLGDNQLEWLINPDHERYDDGDAFRTAIARDKLDYVLDTAVGFEGRIKSLGVHACGIIVSNKPLPGVVPLREVKDEKLGIRKRVTQWDSAQCEAIGLLKMDMLGLDTIDTIATTLSNIAAMGKPVPNMIDLVQGPMDDPDTYALLARGDTYGVFQFTEDGVRNLLRRLKPSSIEELADTTAIYRPGPIETGVHHDYADRKHGLASKDPIHPAFIGSPLEAVLEPTQQLILYQEQISRIAQCIAGMTPAEGDAFRKAMGKKKPEDMAKMQPLFYDGARANGYPDDAITKLWETIEPFAGYAFNLSHSVCYAINSYQECYLKAHYPSEFMAALLTQHIDNKDKLVLGMNDAKHHQVRVGGVSVNQSGGQFRPVPQPAEVDVAFGMSGVSGVSRALGDQIEAERLANGPYRGVYDLVARMVAIAPKFDSKALTNLATVGAFDEFGVSRQLVTAHASELISAAKRAQTQGDTLFDLLTPDPDQEDRPFEDESLYGPDWPYLDRLVRESSLQGIYASGHPLDRIRARLQSGRHPFTSLAAITESSKPRGECAVLAVPISMDITQKGNRTVGTVTIDDGTTIQAAIRVTDTVGYATARRAALDEFQAAYLAGKSLEQMNQSMLHWLDNPIPDDTTNAPSPPAYTTGLALFRPFWLTVRWTHRDDAIAYTITGARELALGDDGTLPIRVRVPVQYLAWTLEKLRKATEVCPGGRSVHLGLYRMPGDPIMLDPWQLAYQQLTASPGQATQRVWPSFAQLVASQTQTGMGAVPPDVAQWTRLDETDLIAFINATTYTPTGLLVDDSAATFERFVSTFGREQVDTGLFDPSSFPHLHTH